MAKKERPCSPLFMILRKCHEGIKGEFLKVYIHSRCFYKHKLNNGKEKANQPGYPIINSDKKQAWLGNKL